MLLIHCLGRLNTQLHESILYQLSNSKNKKRFLIVAYLWEQKEPKRRAEVAELFWPENDVASAVRSLNTLVFRLRKDGLADYLDSNKQTIQITNRLKPIEFDLDQIRHATEGLTSSSNLDHLEAPFQLFHGPFLYNMDLSDLPKVADWAYAIQHEIESKLINVYRLLAPRLIEAGVPEKGSAYGRLLTTFVREDESTWEWFVRCLVAQGDVAQALQELSQYRQEALATDPNHRFSPSLLALGGQLSDPSQVAQLMWAGQVVPQSSPPTKLKSNAPHYITPLTEVIGRGSDRALLLDLIKQEHRLISLIGLGGVGKPP